MRLASLIPLVGFFCNLLLAIFVLLRGIRIPANRVYCALTLCIAGWNFAQYFIFVAPDKVEALYWLRILWFFVTFIPTLLIHFSMLIAEIKIPRRFWICYVLLGVLACSAATDFFMTSVRPFAAGGWYAIPNYGLRLATIPFNLMFVAIVILIRRRKRLPREHRSRLDPVIWSQILLSILGTNDVLPLLGRDFYPFTHVQVYPYGTLGAVIYGIILAFSVLQHQLLDIQVRISRIAAQLIRFTFLFVIGLVLLLVTALVAPSIFEVKSFVASLVLLMLSGILASLLFPKLLGGQGLEKVERRILGDRFEYQDQVRRFIADLTAHSELTPFLDDLHRFFTGILMLESYHIILRDETTRGFTVFRSHPERSLLALPEIKAQSAVFRYFDWGKGKYLSLHDAVLRLGRAPIERMARAQLADFGASLCFPLRSEEGLFGLLLVGAKTTGEPFTATDINVFVSLVRTIGLMVNQIQLKTQVLHAQELDLLGRMSRGMAHDLNNLLTPVSTLLQLSEETGHLDDELLPVALRNIHTMRAYIREALFFSEHLRPDLHLGRLDVLVHQAAEVARRSREKEIKIRTEAPEETLVEMDSVLIQRLVANLITNAIDASPAGGQIRVTLERLPHTDDRRDWLRVRVIDQGEGISRENLNRVLTPYFTTKNHGDSERGFGLGLAICRKIATLHGGSLTIQSQLRRGTTVNLDLPSRAVQPDIQPLLPPASAAA